MKWLFDRIVALIGLCILWPVLLVVWILIRVKMPGGPAIFQQKRVGKDGRLFTMYKFRSMTVGHGGSSVSVAGENRITPLGAKLRKYKLDELPELWNVLIGDMSFVGPRPDVPGYADLLQGEDRLILNLRPGITGPASLKYKNEEEKPIFNYIMGNHDYWLSYMENGKFCPKFGEPKELQFAGYENSHQHKAHNGGPFLANAPQTETQLFQYWLEETEQQQCEYWNGMKHLFGHLHEIFLSRG